MSTRSTSKKILRNFHARNNLWNTFEKRAKEMDCSVDYLVNEAMRLYAATHKLTVAADETENSKSVAQARVAGAPPGPVAPGPVQPAPTLAADPGDLPTAPPPPPPPSRRPREPTPPAGRPSLPRPPGSSPATGSSSAVRRPRLTLIFQGRKIEIAGDQYIIGRGSKSSDLAIKDANISRKHAAVIFHNGAYYLKDLGSTNGVEYMGKPVDSKRIDEGDVFAICGHDLHFSYQA